MTTGRMTHSRRAALPWRALGWGSAAILLLAPLAAMQVTGEVRWSLLDFAAMALLLGSAGLGLELAFRRSASGPFRAGAAIALVAGVLLVCIDGAVGIVGSEREAANAWFLAVPAIALAGATLARFRPIGLAAAMAVTALVQALLPVAIAFAGPATGEALGSIRILVLTAAFTAAWLLSAGLFRRAAA